MLYRAIDKDNFNSAFVITGRLEKRCQANGIQFTGQQGTKVDMGIATLKMVNIRSCCSLVVSSKRP